MVSEIFPQFSLMFKDILISETFDYLYIRNIIRCD